MTTKRLFSGQRFKYVAEAYNGFASFSHCVESRRWSFLYDDYPDQALDECIRTSYIRAVSSETSAFDLSQTASDRWFVHGYETDREVPLQHFSLDLVLAKSSSAKPVATTVKRKMTAFYKLGRIDCEDGWFGASCQFPLPCQNSR